MTERKDISIVGAGKVGTALGVLAARAGYRVVAVADADTSAASSAVESIGEPARVCPAVEAVRAGDIVLLTMPDDAIAAVCNELAAQDAFAAGSIIAHCSGALDSGILSAAREKCGCEVASMHPLQTFPTVASAVANLPGAFFFCEGDPRAVEELRRMAEAIGGKALRIAPGAKALYHAAAVMACNYLSALLDASAAFCERAGIKRATAMEAMEPLVRATLDNVMSMGPAEALTGPIARGDVETVARHLEAMADCPGELQAFYRSAGVWTTRLAKRKGGASAAAIDEIRRLLEETRENRDN